MPPRRTAATLAALGFALSLVAVATAQQPQKTAQPADPDHAAKMAKGLELFKKHVKPVLTARCLRCHGGDHTRGEFDLADRAELLRGGLNGPAVLPGQGKQSLLYKLVTHAREPHMPKTGKRLTPEETARIAEWLDLGAPYDDPLVARAQKSWTETAVEPEARDFWAFRPLRRGEPPAVKTQGWAKTPIDRFVLAKLEEAGIAPNPEADRRTLLRRAYFDLLGLPPTPEEVEAFVHDTSADAYGKLIDRLLNSPHFGERQASYWLDLARFGESHGFEHDYDRPTAYHYRDFVIKAFNADLPYDTFVRWQLAGDELEPDNLLANMATGFLAAGVHSTQITKNEVEKHRYDELDDKLNTAGTAFLGLTLGCARCHDHKYDPVPQADYYRLLATFTTTVRTEKEFDFDPAWYRDAKAKFEVAHAPVAEAFQKFRREQLSARLSAWEAKTTRLPDWTVLDPLTAKSAGGATLTEQADGSLLSSGKKPNTDTYVITAETDETGITAFRLEALKDPTLTHGGPGRAANGNFALTSFRVAVAPKGGKAQPVAVKLKNPRATFEQQGLPVGAAIDGDLTSGWAVDPMFGMSHAAAFEPEAPVGFPGGTQLTFTLEFKNNVGHSIGRPRLSLTTNAEQADLQSDGLPQAVRSALATPADKRTPQQTDTLLDWFSTVDEEARQLRQRVEEHLARAPQRKVQKVLIASEGLPAVRLHTQGEDFFPETFFLRRGDVNNKEGVAAQGFLQVLTTAAERERHWQVEPPAGWRTSYRRVGLASWMTDTRYGAGHLLARVIVNRLWQHHLGQGIVATPSDFGLRGAPPTHPELLDWLAAELIDSGWKLKHLHRLIVTSAVYRQTAAEDEARAKIDRENALCWHFNRRRLEGEAIRDTLLALSGGLDPTMFGPGTLDEGMQRRSVYFTVKRSKLIPMLQIFDAPQALSGVGQRPTTTIAPQALYLMNSPHVRRWAAGLARRAAPSETTPPDEVVTRAYQIAVSRRPTPTELAEGTAFLSEQLRTYDGPSSRERAVTDFCQVLMCLNETVYVE